MLAALVAGLSCSPDGGDRTRPAPPAGNSVGEAMSDDVFDKVELGTYDPSAATPKVADDFTGIRIAMPAKVSVDDLARVPLCGVWTFDGKTMGTFPRIEDSLVYLARNVSSNETATGNFRIHKDPVTADDVKPDPASRPAAPPSGDEPEALTASDATVRGYFNYNLGRFWTVPERPGKWRVHLVLHGVQSNEVEFEVVK
jgi:hypothetical protein